ncbi:DNA topoisomerase 3-alpha [Bienertia sinuspersici]
MGNRVFLKPKKNVGNSNFRCNCGKEALIRTVKNGPNLGMKFYGCPLWPDKHCEFFRWVNEHTDMEENQLKSLEKDTIICELEVELKNRDEKTKKLQTKKAKLEEDMKHMKNESSEMRIEILKCSRNEKYMYITLLFSWIFFGFFFGHKYEV